MADQLSFEDALALLPKDVRAVVETLPPEEARKALQALLVQSEIDYRMLEEADLQVVKDRTTGSFEYGFKSVDVDLTWEELSRPGYLALGAFAEQEGRQVPVAFLVAQICVPPPPQQSAGGDDGAAVVRVSAEELRAAMSAAGCRRRGETAMAVWYVGVSYEYRRQGLGSQLLELAREVGEQAGCKAMWLHVADYNPNATAFYTAYGFTPAPEVFKQGERGRHVLMHMQLTPAPAGKNSAADSDQDHESTQADTERIRSGSGASSSSGQQPASRGFGGGGGGRGAKKGGKGGKGGGKRRALPEGEGTDGWGAAWGRPVSHLVGHRYGTCRAGGGWALRRGGVACGALAGGGAVNGGYGGLARGTLRTSPAVCGGGIPGGHAAMVTAAHAVRQVRPLGSPRRVAGVGGSVRVARPGVSALGALARALG